MDNRLSIFNFSDASPQTAKSASGFSFFRRAGRLSMAGVLAVAIVLVVDWGMFRSRAMWEALSPSVQDHPFERGIVRDRLSILRLQDAPAGLPRVIVSGSSRARGAFQPTILPPSERGRVAIGVLAHGGIGPFEIRSAVPNMLSAEPDAVVLVISEFEITRPLDPRPAFHFGSWSAIGELILAQGISTAITDRTNLFRMAAGCALTLYRTRRVFQRIFVDDLRKFSLDERFADREPNPIQDEIDESLSSPAAKRALKRLAETFGHGMRFNLSQVLTIERGDHLRVNKDLVRNTVRSLAEAGVKVLIVEAPNHPEATNFFDPTIRDDFLELGRGLRRELGMRFIPVESSGPFESDDFYDMTHLDGRTGGTARLTRRILAAVHEVLGLENGAR